MSMWMIVAVNRSSEELYQGDVSKVWWVRVHWRDTKKICITVNMRVNIAAGNSVPGQKSNSIVREGMLWRYQHVNNPDYMVSVWIRDWVLFSRFSTDVPKKMKGAKWILSLLSINLSKRQFEQIGYVQEKRSRRSKWSVQDKKCVL